MPEPHAWGHLSGCREGSARASRARNGLGPAEMCRACVRYSGTCSMSSHTHAHAGCQLSERAGTSSATQPSASSHVLACTPLSPCPATSTLLRQDALPILCFYRSSAISPFPVLLSCPTLQACSSQPASSRQYAEQQLRHWWPRASRSRVTRALPQTLSCPSCRQRYARVRFRRGYRDI